MSHLPGGTTPRAILIRGASGVITYGEVRAGLVVGDKVRRGQVVGHIHPVLKTFKGRPTCMLHLELMSPEATATQWWRIGDDVILPRPRFSWTPPSP